jgi:hypothetical protein
MEEESAIKDEVIQAKESRKGEFRAGIQQGTSWIYQEGLR